MKKPLIIGITASSRSVLRNENIKSIFNYISDELELKSFLQEMGHFKKKISNSDGALIAAFFGANHFESDFLLFNLKDVFNLSNNKNLKKSLRNKELLLDNIKKADGIIISTPVYFGDCSSYVYELLGIMNEEEVIFNDKIVGVLSSGAKRNGGQETTNIYTLCEFFRLGANIIGNGPPTSQFGGTIWAGDKGEIGEDSLGIETAVGTGKKMGEILNIFNLYNNKSDESFANNYLNLTLILPSKELSSGRIKQEMEKLIQKIFDNTFKNNKIFLKINYIEIYDKDIKKCLGCNKCPPPKNNLDCITDDRMKNVRNVLLDSDSILFINYLRNNKNTETWINFKIFFERTRYLRHNNFELTNKPVGIMTLIDEDYNYIFKPNSIDIKFITYFLRHNTICVGPPVFVVIDDSFELSNISNKFNKKFYDSSKTMLSKLFEFSYIMKSTGYKSSKTPLYIPYGFGKFKNY